MSTAIHESIVIPRSSAKVAEVATAPSRAFPLLGTTGQFTSVGREADGTELWDMVVDIGTVRLAERIHVTSDATSLTWESIRGPNHTMTIGVDEHTDGARVTMTLTLDLGGIAFGRLAELVARGIAGRHMVAALERLRHHLTFETA
ncbi:MAG TPA: hypothetical protein VN108_00815 [Marmoricola sp.]|nr:hypothetical protein [Marmoricola sp.]